MVSDRGTGRAKYYDMIGCLGLGGGAHDVYIITSCTCPIKLEKTKTPMKKFVN